jgi:hypothetical protein
MKLWSQFARLGAAVAALAPAVVEADDEPEQVAIPTLENDRQPLAAATLEPSQIDPDANLLEDMETVPRLYVAAQPAPIQIPSAPDDRTSGPPRANPKGGAKPHPNALPHARSWHGGGQRYG